MFSGFLPTAIHLKWLFSAVFLPFGNFQVIFDYFQVRHTAGKLSWILGRNNSTGWQIT